MRDLAVKETKGNTCVKNEALTMEQLSRSIKWLGFNNSNTNVEALSNPITSKSLLNQFSKK